MAKLDAVAKKNGLAGYEEYRTIRANILLVFSSYDRIKSQYVGREQLIKVRVARARADRSMSTKEKQEEIASLNAQRQCALPEVKFKSNIELVRKYYARLEAHVPHMTSPPAGAGEKNCRSGKIIPGHPDARLFRD